MPPTCVKMCTAFKASKPRALAWFKASYFFFQFADALKNLLHWPVSISFHYSKELHLFHKISHLNTRSQRTTVTISVQQAQSFDFGLLSPESFIWSGKSLYSSTSVSWARAFLAMVWKACSTLMASLALVSKYGMSFLEWHHDCARLAFTWGSIGRL